MSACYAGTDERASGPDQRALGDAERHAIEQRTCHVSHGSRASISLGARRAQEVFVQRDTDGSFSP